METGDYEPCSNLVQYNIYIYNAQVYVKETVANELDRIKTRWEFNRVFFKVLYYSGSQPVYVMTLRLFSLCVRISSFY